MYDELFEATAQIPQAKGGAQKDALKAQIAGSVLRLATDCGVLLCG
jgi:hypothetical protein